MARLLLLLLSPESDPRIKNYKNDKFKPTVPVTLLCESHPRPNETFFYFLENVAPPLPPHPQFPTLAGVLLLPSFPSRLMSLKFNLESRPGLRRRVSGWGGEGGRSLLSGSSLPRR